jgi:hypothetical protein
MKDPGFPVLAVSAGSSRQRNNQLPCRAVSVMKALRGQQAQISFMEVFISFLN